MIQELQNLSSPLEGFILENADNEFGAQENLCK